jgi:hypothetical protein
MLKPARLPTGLPILAGEPHAPRMFSLALLRPGIRCAGDMAGTERLCCAASTSKLARRGSAWYSVRGYAKARSCGLRSAAAVRMITDVAGWDEHGFRGAESRGWHALGMDRLDVA